MAVREDPCVPDQVLPSSPDLGFQLQQDRGRCSGENSWAAAQGFPGFGQNVLLGVDRRRWTSLKEGQAELHTPVRSSGF